MRSFANFSERTRCFSSPQVGPTLLHYTGEVKREGAIPGIARSTEGDERIEEERYRIRPRAVHRAANVGRPKG